MPRRALFGSCSGTTGAEAGVSRTGLAAPRRAKPGQPVEHGVLGRSAALLTRRCGETGSPGISFRRSVLRAPGRNSACLRPRAASKISPVERGGFRARLAARRKTNSTRGPCSTDAIKVICAAEIQKSCTRRKYWPSAGAEIEQAGVARQRISYCSSQRMAPAPYASRVRWRHSMSRRWPFLAVT